MPSKKAAALAVVVVFGVGMFVGSSLERRRDIDTGTAQLTDIGRNEIPKTTSLMIDFGNGNIETFHDITFSNEETLLALTGRLAKEESIEFTIQEYQGLGTLITHIGEKKNGDEGKYWQYWVNNRHADVGADQYRINIGDVIEWKFVALKGE